MLVFTLKFFLDHRTIFFLGNYFFIQDVDVVTQNLCKRVQITSNVYICGKIKPKYPLFYFAIDDVFLDLMLHFWCYSNQMCKKITGKLDLI